MPNGLIALLILNIMTIPWRMRVQGCETATPIFGYALLGHLQQRQTRKSFETCVFACQSGSDCFSVNYYYGTTRCDLNNATNKQFPRDFVHHKSSIYIEDVSKEALYCKSLQCANGGTCLAQPTQPRESCVCLSSFTGVSCEVRVTTLCEGQALGMESGAIANSQITASSVYTPKEAWRARLNNAGECWTAAKSNAGQYLQISFNSQVHLFTKIATQGSAVTECWVKKCSVKLRVKDMWRVYEESNMTKTFQGNVDQNTVATNALSAPARGTALRIVAVEWWSCVALRVELYGCPSA